MNIPYQSCRQISVNIYVHFAKSVILIIWVYCNGSTKADYDDFEHPYHDEQYVF